MLFRFLYDIRFKIPAAKRRIDRFFRGEQANVLDAALVCPHFDENAAVDEIAIDIRLFWKFERPAFQKFIEEQIDVLFTIVIEHLAALRRNCHVRIGVDARHRVERAVGIEKAVVAARDQKHGTFYVLGIGLRFDRRKIFIQLVVELRLGIFAEFIKSAVCPPARREHRRKAFDFGIERGELPQNSCPVLDAERPVTAHHFVMSEIMRRILRHGAPFVPAGAARVCFHAVNTVPVFLKVGVRHVRRIFGIIFVPVLLSAIIDHHREIPLRRKIFDDLFVGLFPVRRKNQHPGHFRVALVVRRKREDLYLSRRRRAPFETNFGKYDSVPFVFLRFFFPDGKFGGKPLPQRNGRIDDSCQNASVSLISDFYFRTRALRRGLYRNPATDPFF